MSTTQDVGRETGSVPPSQAVVERVAACKGVDHTELAPLYETVDPDALDMLVETTPHDDDFQITFTYNGYDVTVTGDGVVYLARDGDIER